MNQDQIPKPPKEQREENGENPPTHISNPPLHFESNHHLSLGFLHPLGS
jgi:hypothetical protein